MEFTIRRATREDLARIVAMLADDPLGATRERPGDPAYDEAFSEVDGDPNQLLEVAATTEAIGLIHLTFTRGISSAGMLRANVEAMRVHHGHRDQGVGRQLMAHAIEQAKARRAGIVRLTSHSSRANAHRFYERLGFTAEHIGMKLELA